jgi:hypothetical protein
MYCRGGSKLNRSLQINYVQVAGVTSRPYKSICSGGTSTNWFVGAVWNRPYKYMICRDGMVSHPYKASPATPTKYSCSSVLNTMPEAVFSHGLSFFLTVLQISFTTNITGYSDQVARLLWLPHMRTSKNKITLLICLFFKKNHSHSCG